MKKDLIRRARREEGMALLFALGFLALMLILGLGFVTTSLLAQKLAANNSSRAQARMFARSAAARAMLNIMLYNDQAALSSKTIENYDSICSHDTVARNDDGNSGDAAVTDQLCKSSDTAVDESKLKYQVGTEDYTGENCKAQWLFFYDAPTGTPGRKIIGRAAFQVLPRQAGRLSLYAVTGGSKVENDYGALPHSYRWGRDIAELDLTNTTTLKKWYDSVNANNIPFKYDTLYTSYGTFFTDSPDNKKKWIEYWFAEGKNPILKDAFPILDTSDPRDRKVIYVNRFNISDFYYDDTERAAAGNDNWYDRFKKNGARSGGWESVTEDKKNSADALTALTDNAVVYKENQTTDSEMEPSGLPFLKRIGNDGWSFKSDTNTDKQALEALRRQIAANFNDYCDADSIPTSDVKAAEWSITDSGKFPTYTGNEKTLYINEVAVRIHDIMLDYDTDNYTPKVKKSSLTLLLELINMYDNSDSAASQLQTPANLKAELGLKKLSFKIALRGEYTVKVTYRDNNGRERTKRFTHPVNADYGNNSFVATVNYAPEAASIPLTVSDFPALSTSGYSVGKSAVKDLSECTTQPTVNLKNEIETAAKSQVPSGGTYVKCEIERVRLAHKIVNEDIKFELVPAVLRAKNDVTSGSGDSSKVICPSGTGVDFVRFSGEMTISPGNIDPDSLRNSGTSSAKNYYIGGIEAKDPRQNLNPRLSGNSDWTIAPKFLARENAIYNATGTPPEGAPSMELPDNLGNDFYGRVNRDGSPAGRTDADMESTDNPAWVNGNPGQHVSTAYIRNAPMVSPWEIGLIHRARPWQTLNIKRSNTWEIADIKSDYDNWSDEGTTYSDGDGAILEFVKTGVNCRCMGKVPLTLLRSDVIKSTGSNWNNVNVNYNRDIIRMLFDGIRVGQTMKEFYAETKFGAPSGQSGSPLTVDENLIDAFVKAVDDLYAPVDSNKNRKFRLRSQFLNSKYGNNAGANDSFTFGLADTVNDAAREELIGKTINLLTVNEETPPNIFHVIVVAQSIRDIGGIGTPVSINKIHKGSKKSLSCQIGRFDFVSDNTNWENNTYFDEITGEVKALVTIERVPAQNDLGEKNEDFGRMVVTGIEFID